MAKEATFQVRMDAELKEQAEALFKDLGTSFAEAVRIFAKQSLLEHGFPFSIRLPEEKAVKRFGIAKGKIDIPDDIDKYNDEVLELFGGMQ